MKPRTTGVVFLVAAALFAFIYFYEIRGEEARKQAEQAEKRLFPEVEAGAVDVVTLTPAGKAPIRLERHDGRWQLRQPLDFPADEFAADGMAAALADLTRQQVLADPQPPETYGLGSGALAIGFEAGGAEHGIRIGNTAPVGSNTYVSVDGDAAVYTVASFGVNALRKSLDELRDKRVAHFDQASVQRIEASWPGGGVALEKGDQGWRLVAPLEDAADTTTVDSLLTDLDFLRATGFEDTPPPVAESGLDAPDFAVTLTSLAGTTSGKEGGAEAGKSAAEPLKVQIAIGRALDGKERLVRAGSTSLYRVPADRIDDFPRKVVAYRFKDLSRFAQSDATKLKLVFQRIASSEEGDQPVEVVATHSDTGWTAGDGGFKTGGAASLVSELSRLRAADILAENPASEQLAAWGLAPPQAEISVYGKDDALLGRVQIGNAREDGSVVARSGSGGRVYAMAPEVAQLLPVSLAAFREHFQAPAKPAASPTAAAAPGEETGKQSPEEPLSPPEETDQTAP